MRHLPWLKILSLALLWTFSLALLRSCSNNPWWKNASAENTYFTFFQAELRNLDPTAANYVHESAVIDNVVETPVSYHYLKRPYQLTTFMLEELPVPRYYDAAGTLLEGDPEASQVARVEYLLRLKPGLRYQDHPCFAENPQALVPDPRRPQDFGPSTTREVTAEDFRVSMVRLCDPRSRCTVYAQFDGFLAGLSECREALQKEIARLDAERIRAGESASSVAANPSLPDYRSVPCVAVQVIDRYTFKYVLTRKYPQFLYWMAMHYFVPIPFEALEFYQRLDVAEAGLSYANWPVANGPFLIEECDPNSRIVLARNPNYHDAFYPSEGNPEDAGTEILADAGKKLPFLDRVVFNLEPESIPAWTKFVQGYYDTSGLPTDMFDKALMQNASGGDLTLSPEMAEKGFRMTSSVPPTTYYMAFNMRDSVVGGLDERHVALRQALSIALDARRHIQIFLNGNGVLAEGVIPPGISGAAVPPADMNTVINRWNGRESIRRDIEDAKALLAKAGYPNGIDRETGEPLVLRLHHSAAGIPTFKSTFQWMAEQFAQLGIRLEEDGTDLNQSRQRVSEGNFQFLYARGWVGDYPDPENFLMLFYSENGHVEHHGPNYSNYASPEYDAVFRKLETMPDSPARATLIGQANRILYRDAPVIWHYHPRHLILTHGWLHNYRPLNLAYDTLKYLRVEPAERARLCAEWNTPRRWPVFVILALFTLAVLILRREP